MRTSEILREATASLKGHWNQGTYYDPETNNRCGWGHVMKVMSELGIKRHEAQGASTWAGIVEMTSRVAGEQFPERSIGDYENPHFPVFNDHPDTTEDEVIAVLEKAAIALEEIGE